MIIKEYMRTAFLTLSMAYATAAMAEGQYSDAVVWTVNDLTVQTHTSVSMSVLVSNDIDLSGWQCDITVPENVSVSNITLNPDRTADHVGSFCVYSDNSYRYVAASFSFAGTKENSGRLFSVDMQVDAAPGVYEIALTNLRSTDTDRDNTVEYLSAPCTATLTVVDRPTTPFTLTDGTLYDNPTNYYGVDVTFTKTFKNTDWQAFYVPFDLSYEEWSPYVRIAELSGIHEYDNNEDGTVDETTIEWHTISSGKIVPNVPYMIKALSPGTFTLGGNNKTLSCAPEVDGQIDSSSPRYTYTFTGIYSPRNDIGGSYVMKASGNSFMKIKDGQTLTPNRFYLTINPRNGGYWGKPMADNLPEEIYIMVDGELCGVMNIINDRDDLSDDTYYDITGREVKNPKNGIYIKNGKKIIIK